MDIYNGIDADSTDFITGNVQMEPSYWIREEYGNLYRFWTAKPTDEQRKAVKLDAQIVIDADALKQDLTRFYDNEVTAKQLIDEQPTVGGWISVKDGLPDETEDVIICYEWVGFSGIKYREVTVNDLREVKQISDRIIAWMPLPEPPKEDDA
jgi:hypothetical protein